MTNTPLKGLGDPSIGLVTSIDDAMEMKRWLSERHDVIAVDTETSGLSPYEKGAELRMVQIGDQNTGWAIPWAQWGGAALEILQAWDGIFAVHNLAFDAKWLKHHAGFVFPWERTHDTMIMHQMLYPGESAALKTATRKLIDPRAADGQDWLDGEMKRNGWSWATIPVTNEAYWNYSALDPIITAALWAELRADQMYPESFDLEMNTLRICNEMEDRGIYIDVDYCMQKEKELEEYVEKAKAWGQQELGISIGSNVQLAKYFVEKLGVQIEKRTPGGAPSMDKDTLALLSNSPNPKVAQLAGFIEGVRAADKLRGSYFENFIKDNIGGILHPNIKTMQAKTGRMCLPTSHSLITRKGITAPDDIKIGDETIDLSGNWVRVKNIYKYEDQEVIRRKTKTAFLESTDEHRWVYWTERGIRHTERLVSDRVQVQLTPDTTALFTSLDREIDASTDKEKFAALIGFLVSDGRVSLTKTKNGQGRTITEMRAFLYQSEKKFLRQIYSVLPVESVMNITTRRETNYGTFYEIRLKTRWLRPRLEEAGLYVENEGEVLRDSRTLIPWILSLTAAEVRAFLQAVYLADGATAHPENRAISCSSPVLREVLQLAAYRCGNRSKVLSVEKGSSWAVKPRSLVKLNNDRAGIRDAEITKYNSDVWCVETETGTFSAWGPEGPYLTGNSITSPALQTLPSGSNIVRNAVLPRNSSEVLVASDLDQVEFRIFTHLSQDPGLIETFRRARDTGSDPFTEIGREVYGEPNFQKSDSRRKLIKSTIYGRLYGAGVAKMAATAGVPFSTMQSVNDGLDKTYPGIKQYQRTLENEITSRGKTEGYYIETLVTGRRIPVEQDKTYVGLNYTIQGSGAEVFKQNLTRLDAAGFGEYMVVPVHDEIVLSIPEADAADSISEIKECMTTTEGWSVPLTADASPPLTRWGDKY